MIDRSIFVLEGDGRLFRFRHDSPRTPKPFPRDAKLGTVVKGSIREAIGTLLDRLSEEDLARYRDKVLLIRDIADVDVDAVIKPLLANLPANHWWVYWIDPEAKQSPLGRDGNVEKIRSGARLDDFGAPKPDLPTALLRLLR